MPTKAVVKKTETAKIDQKTPKAFSLLGKINKILGIIFYLIWIVVGVVLLIILYGNFKQGAFKGLLKAPAQTPSQQVQAPTETTLPGIGKVNIECVQKSLSSDEIQTVLKTGDYSKLTPEEKAKLDPCIVEKAEATPAASSSPSK